MANEKRKRSTSQHTINANKKKTKSYGSQKTKSSDTDNNVGCKTLRSRTTRKDKGDPSNSKLKTVAAENHMYRKVIKPSLKLNGTNLVSHLLQLQRGSCKPATIEQIAEAVYTQQTKMLHILTHVETPELRVTAMQWHPSNPHLFVTGGKSGTLQLFQLTQNSSIQEQKMFLGIGPGGTVDAIRFNTKRSGVEVCTASVDGTVSSYHFDSMTRRTLVDTNTPTSTWFCSVDVHQDGKSVYAGDNKGKLAVHHLDSGKSTYDAKLHSSKIKHLEFSLRDPNLFVTASMDKCVQLWDIRKLSQSLERLEHETGVSSATFSVTNGCRLLTTDSKDQLRVYRIPGWTLEHQIQHPHRRFQHLTTIRASWHPRADVFVIGRYPDPNLPDYKSSMRSIDVYSAVTGQLHYELMDSCRFLTSLAYFNCTGSALASTSGRTVNLWK